MFEIHTKELRDKELFYFYKIINNPQHIMFIIIYCTKIRPKQLQSLYLYSRVTKFESE